MKNGEHEARNPPPGDRHAGWEERFNHSAEFAHPGEALDRTGKPGIIGY
jgi:hypothetical protein